MRKEALQTPAAVLPQWEDLVVRQPAPQPTVPAAMPASYLTHELRAPVTAIRLGLEMIRETASERLNEQEAEMLAMAVKNTNRLEGLVNDILDYSKILAGKLRLKKEPCQAREVIADAMDVLRATALSQGVKLIREEGEPLPRVSADPRRVAQVLTNLISNAIKFTPARGTVKVSASRGLFEHEGTVVFKVKDTGRGIPAKDIESIFDMFMTCEDPVKKTEGTGLGLTLARLMVELHGGRIWAESWRGVGATFYFTIPIAPQDLRERIEVYPKPVEYSGLLVSLARRLNAFLALFV